MEIFVMHDGQQFGPLSPEDVQSQIDAGNFSMADYGWTDGLDDWKPLGDVLPHQAQPVEQAKVATALPPPHQQQTTTITTPKPSAVTGTSAKSIWRLIIGCLLFGAVGNSLRTFRPRTHDVAYLAAHWGTELLIAAIGWWLVISYLRRGKNGLEKRPLDDSRPLGDVLTGQSQATEKAGSPPNISANKSDVKTCPFCKEQIRAEAIKCRFCGEWLESSSQPGSALSQEFTKPEAVSQPPVQPMPQPGPQESIESTGTMKAVGRALDEMQSPKQPAVSPIPDSTQNTPPELPPADSFNRLRQRMQKKAYPWRRTTENAQRSTALSWFTWGLLSACAMILFVILWNFNFNESNLQNQVEALTTMVLRLAIGPAIIAWTAKRGYKLLTFSAGYAISLAVAVYYFHAGGTQRKESNKQFATALRQFANEAESTGKTPSLKSTGDPVNDQILQLLSEFYQSVVPVFADMRNKLGDLETKDDAFKGVVSSKASLKEKFEAEVRKQIESERVIQKTRNDLTHAVNAFLQNVASPNVSSQQREQIRRGLEDGIKTTFNPQCETMFTLLERKAKAKREAFEFLVAACDYTEFKEGKTGANALLFSTATRQRIDELLKRADSAAEEVTAFQKKQSENTKAKIDQLGR